MKCVHKFSHYSDTLQKAQSLNYQVLRLCDFNEIAQHPKVIALRHDVDLSLKNALKMARLETNLHIRSTYFIRVSADYNVLFYPNRKIIREIHSMGHEIGLHYSLDVPKLLKRDPVDFLIKEKNVLEDILGEEIMGISLHDPNSVQRIDIDLTRHRLLYDAYSGVFADQLKYISDSRATWREGCMCKHVGETDKLYILTHPFWWFEDASCENY